MARTKCQPFLEWKLLHLDSNLIKVCSLGACWQEIIGSGHGLAQNRKQAITCTNDDPVFFIDTCITRPQWVNEMASGWFNIKMPSYQYRNSRCGDKMILWPSYLHDDVIKWKHFPRCWPFVQGIHPSLVNSPHKGQSHRALMLSLICAHINGWEKIVGLVIWDTIVPIMMSLQCPQWDFPYW